MPVASCNANLIIILSPLALPVRQHTATATRRVITVTAFVICFLARAEAKTSNLPPINFLFAILRRLIGRQAAAFADGGRRRRNVEQLNVGLAAVGARRDWCQSAAIFLAKPDSSQHSTYERLAGR